MGSKTENRRINLYINGREVKNNIKSIRGDYKTLINQQAKMVIGSKDYIQKTKEIKKLRSVMDKHNKTIGRVSKSWGNVKNQMLGMVATGGALYSVFNFFKSGARVVMDFEEQLDSLSAITGLAGDELDWLGDKAIELSSKTHESGVRIRNSAKEIVEAFEIVGSKKPELLANKEALAKVTEEVLILAASSKQLTLADAAEALTNSLNKFNAPASEAGKHINVLAAGSKLGSVMVPELSFELGKFGGIANAMNVSLEQSVAVIEGVGKTVDESGTKVRNIFTILASGADETNPQIVGLDNALNKLGDQNLTVAQLTKMFGRENAEAALQLIANRKEVALMAKELKNTNTAYEQAAINTGNLPAMLDQLKNKKEAFQLAMNEGQGWLAQMAVFFIDAWGSALDQFSDLAMSEEQKKNKAILKEEKIFMETYKECEKIGREDIVREWDKKNQVLLNQYKVFGESFNSEQIRNHNDQMANIRKHKDLIAKVEQEEADELEAIRKAKKDKEDEAKRIKRDKLKIQKELELEIERKAQEQYEKEYEQTEKRLAEKIKDIRYQLDLDKSDKNKKEIDAIKYKYQKLFDEHKDHKEKVVELEKLKNEEIQAKEKEHADQLIQSKKEVQEKINEILLSDKDREKNTITDKYNELIDLAKEYGFKTKALRDALKAELEEIDENHKDILGMSPEDWEKLEENIYYAIDLAGQLNNIWAGYNQIRKNIDQEELQRAERNNNSQKQQLENRLKKGIISQEVYNARIEALDKSLDDKRKERALDQAKRKKAQGIFGAIVNTAEAVTKTLADPVMAAIVGALGLIQIGVIASEPLPKYGYGGFTPAKPTAIEVGDRYKKEWIASGDLVADPKTGPIIKKLDLVQKGIISPDWITSQPISPAFSEMEQAVAMPKQTSSVTGSVINNYNTTNSTSEDTDKMDILIEEFRELKEYMQDPDNRRNYILMDQLLELESENSVLNRLADV